MCHVRKLYLPIETWEDSVRGNILARGLWITLSILMKLLIVATSLWTSNVWLVPTLKFVNVTATPAAALLVLIATLILL